MALPLILLATLLLLQSVPAPTTMAEQGADARGIDLADPAHDVRPTTGSAPAGAPGAGPLGPHDLLRFRVFGEDAEGIEFEVEVADLNAPGAFTTVEHMITFKLAGTPVTYELKLQMFTPLAAAMLTGEGELPATFCYKPDGAQCYPQRVLSTKNWDTNILWARVSKDALQGKDPLPGPTSVRAPPMTAGGSRLEDFVLYSQDIDVLTTGEDASTLFDRVPDTAAAGPLEMVFPLVPSGLRVRLDPISLYDHDQFGSLHFPVVSVPPIPVSTARIRIYNDDPLPRIVNLTHEFLREGPTDEWGVRLVPTLKVPAGSSRLVNIIFQRDASLPFESKQIMSVSARSLTDGIVAAAAFEVVAGAAAPSPEHPDLFLHLGGNTQEVQTTIDQTICRIPFCGGVRGWMNTERVQEGATLDEGKIWGYDVTFGFPDTQTYSFALFDLDYPALHDLVLDRTKPVAVTIRIDATSPIAGTLTTQLTTHGELLAAATKDIAVSGAQDISFEMPIALTSDRIPAGSNISLAMQFVHDSSSAAVFTATPPRFVPAGSKLTLPFIEDPAPKDATVPAGSAMLGLSTTDARESFVNPANTTLFNATVVNEGVLDDIIHFEATIDAKNWTTRVVPAADFRLAPGESAVVGLYVTARRDAVESERARVELRATSQADESAHASIGLLVTVTTGIEIPDEADSYQSDADTDQYILPAKKAKTPTLGLLPALMLIAAVAWSLRRRPG